jgi:transcriptional regulator
MHPNKSFDWQSESEILEFVAERAFAHIFTSDGSASAVVHAPVVVTADARLQFHFSRRNRAADRFAGGHVLISVTDHDGYQSTNWYASEDQVPTWHYQAVEIEGPARRLSEAELIAHLDLLSGTMESQHSPDSPWTRAKMTPGKFEAMVKAIVGFEVQPEVIRGSRKFNQHKGAADMDATIAGQRSVGRDDIAAMAAMLRSRR